MKLREVAADEALILRSRAAATTSKPSKTREERAAERAAIKVAQQERQWFGIDPHYHAVLCDAWGNQQVSKPLTSEQEAKAHLREWLGSYRSGRCAVEDQGDQMVLWQTFSQRIMMGNRSSTKFENIVQTGRITADTCERSRELIAAS